MEALKFSAKTKQLTFGRIDKPTVGSNDVLIKIAFAGICGTDLHILKGEYGCNEDEEVILGHEFSGTVVKIGGNVTTLGNGDKVSVDPNRGCNACSHCRASNPHFCKKGKSTNILGIIRDGGWAQFCVAPEEQVHKLTEEITLEQAVLCEPLSCLAHSWDLISPVTIGKKFLVTGAGIIGNLVAARLHLEGHKYVTVSEPNEERLKLLAKLDTGYELITPEELEKRCYCNPEHLYDFVIDCSGSVPALELGVRLLNYGGTLLVFGVTKPDEKISISPFDMFTKETRIVGSHINPFTFPKAIGLLEALGDRYLNFERLGVKTFELKEYEQAFAELEKGDISKAVFKF